MNLPSSEMTGLGHKKKLHDEGFDVSVVMATYNGSAHILEQLESLAGQTIMPQELVVCDDCSSDNTIEILNDFRSKAPFPVKVISNEKNLGFGDNFLKAASLAHSQWVAFCDQDDIWPQEKLATVKAAAEANPGAVLISHPSKILRDGVETGEVVGPASPGLYPPLSQDPFLVENGHCLIFKRLLLEVLDTADRPYSVHKKHIRMPHDDWITFLGTCLGDNVVLAEALVLYRMHSKNTSEAAVRKSGLSEYLRRGVLINETLISSLAKATRERADQLDRVISAEAQIMHNAEAAATYYRRLSKHADLRAKLWTENKFISRLTLITRLVVQGAYFGHKRGGLGVKEGIKDLAFGTLVRAKVSG
jgi:glycosyltransferase involved in cell wall biosynthesis